MARRTSRPAATDATFESIWRVPDAHVASGRIPGYVAAVRIGDRVAMHAGGRTAIEPDSTPMRDDTRFRIASVTKPIGGALTLRLVEDGVLTLDDPIARWLPEAGHPRVLVAPDAPLDRTVDAQRPITVRHLLTMTSGWGAVFEETPLQKAMLERDVYPGPLPRDMTGDEYIARITDLPLAFQPGDGWLYDSGTDILGVLLSRATGQPLAELLAEHVTGPLGMTATSFGAPDATRLATAYTPGPDGLELLDPPDGRYCGPPRFAELSGGLVSTAADLMRFFGALADGGAPVLKRESVALMTTAALTDKQRAGAVPVVGASGSWGLATGVDLEADQPGMARGRWGWDGGTGTGARVDPTRDTVAVILTQRAMTGPRDGFEDFWAAVDAAARDV
jgi:CubicO group peptidase (beta-lactamase class C family)